MGKKKAAEEKEDMKVRKFQRNLQKADKAISEACDRLERVKKFLPPARALELEAPLNDLKRIIATIHLVALKENVELPTARQAEF
jgi:hypothetical protein